MPTGSRLARIAPYALVGAGAGYLYHVAAGIQYHAREGVLGPDVWPKAMLVLVIAICFYQIALALVPGTRNPSGGVLEELIEESAGKHGGVPAKDGAESHPRALLGGMALSALYVWSISILGFFTATVPYLVAFIVLGGYRRRGVIAAVSVIGTLVLFFLFTRVVYVSLPIGVEPFAQVTLLLMKILGVR